MHHIDGSVLSLNPHAHFMIAVTTAGQWLRLYHRPHKPGVVPAGLTSNR